MDLTPAQRTEADRIYADLRRSADADLRALAELLASKPDPEVLGRAEFQARDAAHAIAAKAVEATLAGRKKGGT
jgi:hypothetical protein